MSFGGEWERTLRWGVAGTAAVERVTEGGEDGEGGEGENDEESGGDEAVVVIDRTASHRTGQQTGRGASFF